MSELIYVRPYFLWALEGGIGVDLQLTVTLYLLIRPLLYSAYHTTVSSRHKRPEVLWPMKMQRLCECNGNNELNDDIYKETVLNGDT